MLIRFRRVNVVPEVLEPSMIYIVKPEGSAVVTLCFTDEQGVDQFPLDRPSFQLAENLISKTAEGFLPSTVKIDGQDAMILSSKNDYIWKDNVSFFNVKNTTGGNNPTFGIVMGNVQGLVFSAGTMNQVWCDYHIDHDYAMGTVLYPHVHFMPMSNAGGVVRWGIEYYVAKGHGQEKFQGPFTLYIEQVVVAGSLNLHVVSEATDLTAIPATHVEPDTFIKTRIFRDANHPNDTYPNTVHAWCADLHYQAARMGTMNKSPNFFT